VWFGNNQVDIDAAQFPQSTHHFEELIRFECKLPANLDDNITDMAVDNKDNLDRFLELEGFLDAIPLDNTDNANNDVCLNDTQFPAADDNAVPPVPPFDEEDFEPNNTFAVDVEVDVSACVPAILQLETTLETCCCLAKEAPWILLKCPKFASKFTDSDKAKHSCLKRWVLAMTGT